MGSHQGHERRQRDVVDARLFLASLVLLGASLYGGTASAATRGLAEDVTAQAHKRDLANAEGWQRLIHYQPGFWGGLVSEVDGADFFLSPNGRRDAEAELVATVRAFFAPVVRGHEDAHATCRFPARLRWLDEQLHFAQHLVLPPCPRLSSYYAALDPVGMTFVYATDFPSNPASASGHTFLRAKKRPRAAGPRDESQDTSIEFAAIVDTNNPVLYAIKGLSGLFHGKFQFHPFDAKARYYLEEQGRDLWEYDLSLTESEISLLTLHLWELAATNIDYYYLSGNCSYHLLAAIEGVRLLLSGRDQAALA